MHKAVWFCVEPCVWLGAVYSPILWCLVSPLHFIALNCTGLSSCVCLHAYCSISNCMVVGIEFATVSYLVACMILYGIVLHCAVFSCALYLYSALFCWHCSSTGFCRIVLCCLVFYCIYQRAPFQQTRWLRYERGGSQNKNNNLLTDKHKQILIQILYGTL